MSGLLMNLQDMSATLYVDNSEIMERKKAMHAAKTVQTLGLLSSCSTIHLYQRSLAKTNMLWAKEAIQ